MPRQPRYYLLDFSPEHLRVLTREEKTASQEVRKSHALVFTGGFFIEDGNNTPIGLLFSNGRKLASSQYENGRAATIVPKKGTRLPPVLVGKVIGSRVTTLTQQPIAHEQVLHLVTGGPLLVKNGRNVARVSNRGEGFPPEFFSKATPRVVIGVRRQGRVRAIVSLEPWTLQQAASYARRHMRHGLNLDGGNSTHVSEAGKPLVESRSLPAYVAATQGKARAKW